MSSKKIDFRVMTRNFLLGENDDDASHTQEESELLTERNLYPHLDRDALFSELISAGQEMKIPLTVNLLESWSDDELAIMLEKLGGPPLI